MSLVLEEYDVMYEVIRFIYCAEVVGLEAIAEKLILAADMYLIDELKGYLRSLFY